MNVNGFKVNARDGVAIRRLHQLTITALLDSEVVLVDAPPGRSVFNPKDS